MTLAWQVLHVPLRKASDLPAVTTQCMYVGRRLSVLLILLQIR